MDRTNGNAAILLTPRAGGQGAAIAVVRICGGGVGGFLGRVFSKSISPGKCVHGELSDGKSVIDDVVVVAGTDWADICLHGGAWVVESVLNLARREGFEILDSALPAADAAMDGVSKLEREVAAWLPLARTRQAVRMLLDQPRAWSEAKEKGFDAAAVLGDRTLWRLLHAPEIAIVGEPNVGKSTLANRMFGQQRSITADVPGTTRDWVGEMADIGGMPAVLIDTPGLRQTEDEIEREAISASVERTRGCELVIEVLDATREPVDKSSPAGAIAFVPTCLRASVPLDPQRIVVVNKVDCAGWDFAKMNAIGISAKTGQGIDDLYAQIHRKLGVEAIGEQRMRWWTDRQQEELQRANL